MADYRLEIKALIFPDLKNLFAQMKIEGTS